jgi:sugar lactone lactonase YvrE
VIIQQVVDELNKRGRVAFNEHPGYVHVPVDDQKGFWTSDLNDTWDVQLLATDGTLISAIDTHVPRTCTDPIVITDAIEKVLNGGNQ